MNFNAVQFAGNITRDIDLRFTSSGIPVANFTIASNRIFKDSKGEKKEEVTFVEVVSWNKQAEVVAKFFKKGKPIFITGRLQNNEWEDKEGVKHHKIIIAMDSFCFVDSKQKTDGEPSAKPSKIDPEDVPGYVPEKDKVPF